MMLESTEKLEVVFMRSEKIDPEYLSYFKVDSKGKQKNLDPLNLED